MKNPISISKTRKIIFGITLLLISSLILGLSISKPENISGVMQQMPEVNVDRFGKANANVMLEIPQNIGNIVPSISLTYNSLSGNIGQAGNGWNLSGFHWITRDNAYGIDYTVRDHFTSSLAGSLVKNLDDGNFYSKVQSFIAFVPNGKCGSGEYSAPCSWIATDKSGNRYYFGNTADSFITLKFNSPDITVPKIWALSKVEDIYGNGYTVSYDLNEISYQYSDKKIRIIFQSKTTVMESQELYNPFPQNKIIKQIEITGDNLTRIYKFS